MGPWDIMSQHFVRQDEPPPGLSSFTKIRLGWIKAHQVQIAKPGETSYAFLSPLSKGGELLVVKIPLDDGTYYLVENRQPIGFDKMLPDSGILVLKVYPEAAEGYGTVEVMSASGSRDFDNATYKLEMNNRNIFINKRNNIAIIPLWKEKDNLGVLVTRSDGSDGAFKAARAIQILMDDYPGPSESEKEAIIHKAITAFKNKDFAESYAISKRNACDRR
jgi:hypothetical protein